MRRSKNQRQIYGCVDQIDPGSVGAFNLHGVLRKTVSQSLPERAPAIIVTCLIAIVGAVVIRRFAKAAFLAAGSSAKSVKISAPIDMPWCALQLPQLQLLLFPLGRELHHFWR